MNYNCTEFRKVQIFRCQLLVYELFHTIFFVIIVLCYFFLDLKSPALWSLAVCMVVVGGELRLDWNTCVYAWQGIVTKTQVVTPAGDCTQNAFSDCVLMQPSRHNEPVTT